MRGAITLRMRVHPVALLFIVAVLALVTATTQSNCIIGCKCEEEQQFARKIKVQQCERPFVLSNKTLMGVSKKISAISFKDVVVQQIEKDAFKGFAELESILIEDSSIGPVDPNAFNLPELGTLNFVKTTFEETPTLNSEYLEELIFNDCNLSQVPNLEHLPAISFLSLTNNFIKYVDESAFDKVTSLEEVTLANNSITELPRNLFSKQLDFNTLNLDHNPLKTFDLTFGSDLELLSLRNCQLSTFDGNSIRNLSSLSSLDLSGNEFSILPLDAFELMKDLTYLDLSDNKLIELDDDIFLENTKLDKIIFDNNKFAALPNFQTKDKTFRTYSFSCKNCELKSVKGVFDNMKALVILDLSNNKIDNIEEAFTELHSLNVLLLPNNRIKTIVIHSFAKNSELATLDISNNPLVPLDPVVFASMTSLKKLNASSSNLGQLWSNYNAELPSLEYLFIEKNNLTKLSSNDLKIIPKLKGINLQDNPIACTEDLYDFVGYVVNKSIHPMDEAVKTHDSLMAATVTEDRSIKHAWQSVLPDDCLLDSLYDDGDDFYEDDDTNDDDNEIDDDDDDDDDDDADDDNIEVTEYDDVDGKDEIGVGESVLNPGRFDLAKANYILSITSVFILTALLVLFVAVMVTLLILKRKKPFNIHTRDLPRFKIPLWYTQPGQKKHSGSVYRPLSEELSGSRTPIINRYDFNQSPQVHNSLP